MKKILMLFLMGLFLISFASAWTPDNRVKSYDPITETIVIEDRNLIMPERDLVKIQLKDNTYTCGIECSAIWNITVYSDDDNFLSNLVFEQIKGGSGVSEIKYEVVTGYDTVMANDYGKDCSRKDSLGNCKRIITGTHQEQIPIWTTFNPERKLPIGNYIVKLSGKKAFEDTVDWIPTFYGKEIRQWAFWASTDPTSVWEFNEPSGATQAIDSLGLKNLTVLDTSVIGFVPGKLVNAVNLTEVGPQSELNTTGGGDQLILDENDFTIAYWVNGTGTQSYLVMAAENVSGVGRMWEIARAVGGNQTFGDGTVAVLNTGVRVLNETWNRVVWVRSGTGSDQFRVYVNNDNKANTTLATNMTGILDTFRIRSPNEIGTFTQIDSLQIYNGFAWSVSDVNFDYNGGEGREANDTVISLINITLNTPNENEFFTASPIGILFNATLSNNNTIVNASLYIDNAINFSINPGTNFTELITNVTLTNGFYTWFVEGVNDAGVSINSSTRNFTVDINAPNINILFPTNGTNILTLTPTINVSFNVSVSDNIGLSSCFFFNSTANITLSCPNNASVVLGQGFHTLGYYANDSAGNLRQNLTTIFVNLINETWFFVNPIIENTLQDINLIITATNIDTFDGTIFYNNTGFIPSSVTFNSTQANITTRLNATQVDAVTNITLFSNYTLNGINITSQEINQSVLFFNIDNCTTFTNRILNFTVVDEKEQTFIPGADIEVAVNIFDSTRTILILNISNTLGNPAEICLNINLTSTASYSLNSVIRYEKSLEYANEYFNIVNFNLTNNSETQDIILFDLNISDSTPFEIVFTNQFLVPLTDVLIFIERQYISEDTFKVVELPLTDSKGESIGHFVINEVLYNIKFVKEGILIAQFLNIRTFCEDVSIGECSLTFSSTGESSLPPTLDSLLGVTFESPIFNSSTETVRFDFVSVDGTPKEMIMNVTRNDVFGNRTLCSDTLTASSGTLICTVGNLSDTLLVVSVSSNSEPILLSSLQINSAGNYGNIGFIVWFIFMLVYLLAFADTKTGVLIGLAISYVGAITMGISNGTIVGIASSGIWIIVITLVGIWKINKENAQ